MDEVKENEQQPVPDLPAGDMSEMMSPEKLQEELEATKTKAAEYLEGWQRARAEFANYKKRVEREQADSYQTAAATILTRMLPVLDDFELALKNAPAQSEGGGWIAGIHLVQRKFNTILENEGISRIEAEGKEFDPNIHEAVIHEESEAYAAGLVIEVLRQGYKLGDRVLRPALVKVAK